MKTRTIETFRYAELSDKAKEAARDWYREASAGDPSDLECVLEDAASIAPLLGLEFGTRPVKLMNGKTRYEVDISYSVGFCQSDFAGFSGTWRASEFPKTKKGKPRACPVKDHAPEDSTLARICRELSRIARECPDMVAVVSYHHYYGLQIECTSESGAAFFGPSVDEGESVKEAMKDFAQWIYQSLRAEVEYQTSDDAVTEAIEANDYEFTRDGSRKVIL